MVKFCAVLIAVVACWAVVVQGEDDLETAWAKHRAHFTVRASSAAELAKRKASFARVHAQILEHNSKESSSFLMVHNRLSHLTSSEKTQLLGFSPINSTKGRSFTTFKRSSPAESVDLRDHECMPAVKNQGGCGSCWAFAATTVVEFGHCLPSTKSVLLSEQQLVDCSTKDGGCNGGNYESAWEYIASAGGQQPSYTYEYTGTDGTCAADQSAAVATVSSEVQYVEPNDIQTMQTLLSSNQLLGVAIAVVDSFFQYGGGVYDEFDCEKDIRGYHAIVAVGYGSLDGTDYWVVRNSWGADWGVNGYILFKRGNNLCKIENYVSTVAVTSG